MAATLIAVQLAPADATGEPMQHMNGWEPKRFEISCGDDGTPHEPAERRTSCIRDQTRHGFEATAAEVAGQYQRDGYPSPYRLGPVIKSFDGADARAVRVFTFDASEGGPKGPYAAVRPRPSELSSDACHRNGNRVILINPIRLGGTAPYLTNHAAAHEVFHAAHISSPETLRRGLNRLYDCYLPLWIMEGKADAVAINYLRNHPEFAALFPVDPGLPRAEAMAGLRRYNLPLFYHFPEKQNRDNYATSSFWLHLAEFYHSRDLKFLYEYSEVPAPVFGDGREDWLRWLDERLEADPKVRTPLYRVYPGFLTHFAGEWAKGGNGDKFPRNVWLTRAFGGCKHVTVTPNKPYEEFSIDIHPMAGRCIRVRIAGVGVGDLVAVKVGALVDDPTLQTWDRLVRADSLHLGFVDTNDQTRFNCAQLARKRKPPPGLVGCLFEPATGMLGSGPDTKVATRMWYASSLEPGPGLDQRRRGDSAAIDNYYILSYVPPSPSLEKLEQKPAATVRIGVGLEWATLSINGTSVNRGATDGSRSAMRQRAVAARGFNALEGDMTVPASTGWIDHQGMDSIVGGGIWDMIGEARKFGSELALEADPAGTVQRLLLFKLAEARIVPLGGAPSEERIEVVREFHVSPVEPLPEGATGTFQASISGEDRENELGYFSEKPGDATLTVEENSRGAFRASVSGDVCVVNMAAVAAAAAAGNAPDMCPFKIHVSGAISKPFAYLYRPHTELVSEETEGEKLYNRYGPPRLMRAAFGGGGAGGGGNGGGGGGADTGGGETGGGGGVAAASAVCRCQCPELAIPDNRECRTQCRPQWAMCEIAAETPPERAPAPKPPTPTLAAQRKWFSRLVGGYGLAPEVEEMLIDDFATMSDETRKYLIRRYRDGVD